MSEHGFWDDPETHHAIMARLPKYRLSKFQRALPEAAATEMVGGYLLSLSQAKQYTSARGILVQQ